MARPKKERVVFLTYNQIDGGCTAAVGVLKYPDARVYITSQIAIGKAFRDLASTKPKYTSVYVCGIGVADLNDLNKSAQALQKTGCKIIWICGRGYLDDRKERFGQADCELYFENCGSNTMAMAKYLGLEESNDSLFIRKLAELDRRAQDGSNPKAEPEQKKWLDLLEASMGQYRKFGDAERYAQSIKKLATDDFDEDDRMLIEQSNVYGNKYLIYGSSKEMRDLRVTIGNAALAIDRPVLILGESGVGKEHAARLIHERSGKRATGPFVAVNCATFSGNPGLVNATLFGHVKGAYTGASQDRPGAFKSACGGVLFLDEFGELPMDVQGKLLRVVEDGLITPVGQDQAKPERTDVRLIAATNRNLPEMIRHGEFRADLYHRLSTLCIEIPPLRERQNDIKRIATETIERLKQEGYARKFSKEDFDALQAYEWPGNVRQLIKIVERSVFLNQDVPTILIREKSLGDLTMHSKTGTGEVGGFLPNSPEEIQQLEKIRQQYAVQSLKVLEDNKTQTAKYLGIARQTLQNILDSIDS